MSEFLSETSILLSVIGAITGALALYLTYKSQKPDLNVKVKYCGHHYQKSDFFDSQMEMRFLSGIQIGNQGLRGTTVNKIELS
jgi:hypothetical protein